MSIGYRLLFLLFSTIAYCCFFLRFFSGWIFGKFLRLFGLLLLYLAKISDIIEENIVKNRKNVKERECEKEKRKKGREWNVLS